jgi:hypothetical protein
MNHGPVAALTDRPAFPVVKSIVESRFRRATHAVVLPRKVMFKIAFAAVFLLISSLPAYSKPRGVYPVSCDTLWAAVKDTLYGNPRDYGIQLMNNEQWRASFIVIGNLTVFTNHVALRTADGGCLMKDTITQIGPDNSDWRRFHKRVARSLDKVQAITNPTANPTTNPTNNPTTIQEPSKASGPPS